MANTKGSIRTPSGVLVFKVCGWTMNNGCGMSVLVCVVADSRMDAVLQARSFGVRNASIEVDDPPDAKAAMLAADSLEGAIWADWFCKNEWAEIRTLPGLRAQ